MTQNNSFSHVIPRIQQTPQQQRPAVLLDCIAEQMQACNTVQQAAQLGQDIEDAKPQLVKALQS